MRFTRVDLPTLGRPTTARTGCPAVPNPAAPSGSAPLRPAPSKSSKSSPMSTQPSSLASNSVTLLSPSAAFVPGAGEYVALSGEAGDLVDHPLKGQVGRVEEHRVGGLLRLRRVEAVPAGLGGLGLAGIGAQLGGPAAGTRARVGGQEDLELRGGRDDGADVTALGHDAGVGRGDDRTLLRDQVRADRGNTGNGTDPGGDLLGADIP